MIYFIEDTASGAIKIGHATDPWVRFSCIQCHCPSELRLLALEEGGEAREAELHQRFAVARRRGEWFEPTAELLSYVRSLPPAQRPRSRSQEFWSGLRDVELSALSGVSRPMLSRIRRGLRRPSPEVAIRLQELTGVSAVQLVFGDLADRAA